MAGARELRESYLSGYRCCGPPCRFFLSFFDGSFAFALRPPLPDISNAEWLVCMQPIPLDLHEHPPPIHSPRVAPVLIKNFLLS